ncbi:hypothetical protein Dsin_012031 [Dipteronia sinensis]|uniref:RNase H type-1 domain-containing protein n=1 Tax=Dipteronia sinensis TaxID=43782 RepID=A0AAE0E7M8_9ROSI|nr:hypothetical protein Dsin_012031 [Dipteronia sinensis]
MTKGMEKGLSMGFDFNGRKEELMEIMARLKDGNDNRFSDLGFGCGGSAGCVCYRGAFGVCSVLGASVFAPCFCYCFFVLFVCLCLGLLFWVLVLSARCLLFVSLPSWPSMNKLLFKKIIIKQDGTAWTITNTCQNDNVDLTFYYGEFVGSQDIISAEILAIARACHLTASRPELEGKRIIFESDSKMAVSWINSRDLGSWVHSHLILDIRSLLGSLGQACVEFSSRDSNSFADVLAKKGAAGEVDVLWWCLT